MLAACETITAATELAPAQLPAFGFLLELLLAMRDREDWNPEDYSQATGDGDPGAFGSAVVNRLPDSMTWARALAVTT